MTELNSLLATIKKLLKQRGMTYRELSRALEVSEPTVKRMFATGSLSVARLAQLGGILGLSMAELTQMAAERRPRIHSLGMQDETLLVSDTKLLLVAVCALNHWTMSDILAAYEISEAECIQRLVRLDRLGLIQLLPDNRIRLVIARDFDWQPQGPIRRFFRSEGLGDFLDAPFVGANESFTFVHGMLTPAAFAQIQPELQRLRARFAALHEESLAAPMSARQSASLLLALRRDWEPAAFAALRRER